MTTNDLAVDPLVSLKEKQNYIVSRVQGVAFGYNTGLYLYGRPGTAKTYLVRKTLNELNIPYAYMPGHLTPLGLFDLLDENHNRVIVLDDVADIFNQPIALQLLLAALGSGDPREPRKVRYKTATDDRTVWFTGSIIAISNLRLGHGPVMDALKSRAVLLPYSPSDDEMNAAIREIAKQGWRRGDEFVTPEECNQVAEFTIEEMERIGYRSEVRMFVDKALPDYLQFREGDSMVHWQELVKTTLRERMQDQEDESAFAIQTKRDDILNQRQIVLKIQKDFPDEQQRIDHWKALTGMSERTYARRLQDIKRSSKRQSAKLPVASAACACTN